MGEDVIRRMWCGFCGAVQFFTQVQLDTLYITPPCTRCAETDWRDEWDELVAPNYREQPDA